MTEQVRVMPLSAKLTTRRSEATDPPTPSVERRSAGAGRYNLKSAIAACRNALVGVGLFSLCINLLQLTIPIYMMQLFDRVLTSRSSETLLVLTGIAVLALVVLGVLEGVRSRVMIGVGSWLDRKLSAPVLQGSVRQALGPKASPSVHGLRDLSTLRGFLAGPAILPLLDSPWMPVFCGLIFLLHPLLGWIAIAGSVVLLAIGIVNELLIRGPQEQAHSASGKALGEAEAAVRNADTIEAMGMMPALTDRWSNHNARALALHSRVDGRTGVSAAISKSVRLGLQVAMLAFGAWLALQGEITPGVMIAASILMTRALAPVEQSIGSYRMSVAAWAAYRRLARQPGLTAERGDAMPLPTPNGRVAVEGVLYAHPGTAEPVLRSIKFEMAPGETLGIIGPSGCGKTTLARLLVGNLRPTSGHVRLDDAEVSVWDPDDRGQHIGYVAQSAELFAGTVRENIARMSDGSPDAVLEAARLAGVHELVLRLPQGYESEIVNGGQNLSGGERQRIALARALYGDPRLVVLDEPNSSLDSAGEEALVEAIERLRERGITCVVISHRPSILRQVDRILVLRDGQIAGIGPRDEVLRRVMVPQSAPQAEVANG